MSIKYFSGKSKKKTKKHFNNFIFIFIWLVLPTIDKPDGNVIIYLDIF